MRIFSGGAYWLYSTSTWERMPDNYNPWTPSKYGHLFPKVESIDEVDYNRDDLNRRGDVNLARLKLVMKILTHVPGNAWDVVDDVLLINGIPTNKENK